MRRLTTAYVLGIVVLLVALFWTLPTVNAAPEGAGTSTSKQACDCSTYNALLSAHSTASRLGDRVWYDENRNGLQDTGEPGLPAVTVELYTNDACSGTPVATTATNEDGAYTFTDLNPGTYSIKFVPRPGYAISPQNQGDDTRDSDADPSTGCTGGIILAFGQQDTRWDAGMFGIARVGGFVWADIDGDGTQDPDETRGIYGVPVHVTGVDELGRTTDVTRTTGTDGLYLVEYLAPGTYTVTAPANYEGFARTSPSPLTTTLGPDRIEDLSLNFGYIAPTAIQLTSFDILATATHVNLEWSVRVEEGDPPLFRIWRSADGENWGLLTGWRRAQYVHGSTAYYTYVDNTITPGGLYVYQLEGEGGVHLGPWEVRVPEADDDGSTVANKRLYIPILFR
ncbi:MAG: hypothetical protein GXO55_09850 [Chloroflexi bacterium]|nr:hypothetical protein [Chloroflexota bacterium]